MDAFLTLKEALMKASILALLDFSKRYIIEVDAFGTTIGAALTEDSHLISYFNKKLP